MDIKKRIAFKGMEHSAAVENFINDKLEKVMKLIESERPPIFVDVVINTEHGNQISDAEIRINGPHFSLVAHDQEREMYAAIEKAADRMFKEVSEMRKKRRKEERNGDTFKGA